VLRDLEHAHATCGEYRAAAGVDRDMIMRRRRIAAPVLVLWSTLGPVVAQRLDSSRLPPNPMSRLWKATAGPPQWSRVWQQTAGEAGAATRTRLPDRGRCYAESNKVECECSLEMTVSIRV
jgi:hypothetical protein